MPEQRSRTYLTPDGRVVGWRWRRVPSILWLMLVGTYVSTLLALGRLIYLFVRSGPIRPDDDFNLTVFMVILCAAGSAVFSLVVYLLARPEEPDE